MWWKSNKCNAFGFYEGDLWLAILKYGIEVVEREMYV